MTGLKRKLLVAFLCVGIISGISACGQMNDLDVNQGNNQPNQNVAGEDNSESKDGSGTDNWAQGNSTLLSGSSASPIYSSDLRMDNGKDPYMAVIRERLEMKDPEDYLEYEEEQLQYDDVPLLKLENTFLGMSVGGIFNKWFWKEENGRMTGQQRIAAVDVYGAKAEFDVDAKPYASDPDRTGMVTAVGGMAGLSGYVLLNYGYSAEEPEGVSIIGEEGELLERYEIPFYDSSIDMMADKDYNLYIINKNEDHIECTVYNSQGQMILSDSGNRAFHDVTLTAFSDGTVGIYDSNLTIEGNGAIQIGALYQIDLAKKESTLLAKRTANTYFLSCFNGETLIYADENGIYKCGYSLEGEEALYLWNNHGFHVSDVRNMSVEPDGSIDAIVNTTQGNLYYLHLIPTPEGIETLEISFAVSKVNTSQYVEAVYHFNMEHPAYLISLDVYDEETKLLTELTAGKGPVLVDTDVVQFEANKKLWEKLDDKLAEWGLEGQLLEKPMLGGRIDGEQYGLVFSWDMYSFLSKSYYGENWNYEEFWKYVKENNGLKRIFSEQAPQNFIELFFLRSMEDSYFIDTAENKAHFDTKEFTEVAEFAKNLETDDWPEEREELIPKVRSGKYLGDFAYLNSPEQIAYYWEVYGEDVNFVGFPGKEGSCHFIRTMDPLAVRSSASEEEKQVAFWFLSEMLGEEAQRNLSRNYSVREDVFLEQLEEPENQTLYRVGGETFTVTADWEAAKAKLLSIYEKCIPQPVMPEGMEIAISDELWECFYGTKSIEEVGKTLQNRVQLYLDEKN